MSFSDIINFMISAGRKNLQTELDLYFEQKGTDGVSRQAFSKARENVNPQAICELNERVSKKLEKTMELKTYQGYRLISVDGTILDLPNNENLKDHFGYASNSTNITHCAALGMVIYDLLNHISLTGELYSYFDSEKKRILEIADRLKERETLKNPLFILDRGYPSFDLMCKFAENNQKYLIRVSRQTLKEISSVNTEDEIVHITRKGKAIQVRVVTITLNTGNVEKIVTNVFEKFDISQIKELYAKRWGIETNYHYIKNVQLLECFTGESVNAILQDFYVSLLIMNIAVPFYKEQKDILNHNQENKTFEYNPSLSELIYKIKIDYMKFLSKKRQSHNLIKEYFRYKNIMKFAYAVIPNRTNPRKYSNTYDHRKAHIKKLL